MKIIKDDRKKELYLILKDLIKLSKKEDLDDYLRLKKVYNRLLYDIFGNNFKEDDEGFYWDKTRNQLDNFFTIIKHIKTLNDLKKIKKMEKLKNQFLFLALNGLNELEKYLK